MDILLKTTETLKDRSTTNQDGFLVSDYATDYIFRGKTFSVIDFIEIAGSTTLYYVFDLSKAGFAVNLPPEFSSTGGPISITIYGGTDYTGVNSLNVRNRNVRSSITPKATLKDSGTGTVKGVISSRFLINATHKAGGDATGSLPFVLDGVNYLIEVENLDSTACYFSYKFVWFED